MPSKRPCIFCAILAGKADVSRVYEDEQVIAFMDIHPLGVGHVLVIPRQHAVSTRELDDAPNARLWQVGHHIAKAIRRSSLPCDGHHYLMNDGRAANQTVMHAHLHIIPRQRGDQLKTPFRILDHVVGMVSPLPISKRKRLRLDQQAEQIRRALEEQPLH